MAISGGCTQSYTYGWRGGKIVIVASGGRLRSECMEPKAAAAALLAGDAMTTVTVAGGDAPAFREAVTGKTIKGEVAR
jgi:hypothetical protein